jgi:hypothetical protein
MLVKTSHDLSIRFDISSRSACRLGLCICRVFPPLKLQRESTVLATGRKSLGRATLNGHPRDNDLERSGAFGEQERVVGGIDNSGKRCATFLAIEPIAFKAAGVDIGIWTLRTIARRGVAR